jgi:hypothetical protein
LLGDGEVAPGEGEVVIGGKQGDHAKGVAADGLGETEEIEGGPRRGCCWQFWRNRRLLAAGWRPGGAGGRGHGAGGGGDGERGLQGISATSRLRSSQAPVAAGDSDPFPLHPLEAAQRCCSKGGAAVTDQRLLGASPANQCLQRAPKGRLVASGPGADDIDEQVSPGHGGD